MQRDREVKYSTYEQREYRILKTIQYSNSMFVKHYIYVIIHPKL